MSYRSKTREALRLGLRRRTISSYEVLSKTALGRPAISFHEIPFEDRERYVNRFEKTDYFVSWRLLRTEGM